jgi:hypothetical protein
VVVIVPGLVSVTLSLPSQIVSQASGNNEIRFTLLLYVFDTVRRHTVCVVRIGSRSCIPKDSSAQASYKDSSELELSPVY